MLKIKYLLAQIIQTSTSLRKDPKRNPSTVHLWLAFRKRGDLGGGKGIISDTYLHHCATRFGSSYPRAPARPSPPRQINSYANWRMRLKGSSMGSSSSQDSCVDSNTWAPGSFSMWRPALT